MFVVINNKETFKDGNYYYMISASHSKKFSSLIGPATIPSGGFNVSSVDSSEVDYTNVVIFFYQVELYVYVCIPPSNGVEQIQPFII